MIYTSIQCSWLWFAIGQFDVTRYQASPADYVKMAAVIH